MGRFNQENYKVNEEEKDIEQFETWNGIKFYYIAGYTSGGAPYGITLEEYKRDIKKDSGDTKEENHKETGTFLDGDIPF